MIFLITGLNEVDEMMSAAGVIKKSFHFAYRRCATASAFECVARRPAANAT